MTAARVIKMCDMPIEVALKVFTMLNSGKVRVTDSRVIGNRFFVITDEEPKNLVFPEGWYYAKGSFRNKHKSTTGMYEEAMMKKSSGEFWKNWANYCPLE